MKKPKESDAKGKNLAPERDTFTGSVPPVTSNLSNFLSAAIGGLVGVLGTGIFTLIVTSMNISASKSVMAGNNVQRDEELIIQECNTVIQEYVAFENVIETDSLTLNKSLGELYRKQFETTGKLMLIATPDLVTATAELNKSYIHIFENIVKIKRPLSYDERINFLLKYTSSYYKWLPVARIEIERLNLSSQPGTADSSFLIEYNAYQNFINTSNSNP